METTIGLVVAGILAIGGFVWVAYARGKREGVVSTASKFASQMQKEKTKKAQGLEDITAHYAHLRRLLREAGAREGTEPKGP